ncbi:hypothetical protein Q5P01_013182 [Channa striata]|uniref:VWFA domain-containing protein n=1 Tax=Channa striata TaxID=64152 RepID=A0AA88SHH6_CHASR|nr:hypothetical protein Q5P01_013182 [Channa striata]
MGVQTFAIGTRSSDLGELQKISHDPSSTLSVSEFTELPSVQEKLSSVVSTVEVKVTPITPTVPVVQYSREPAVQFYLNTYTTKDEILDTVRGLRHKGGRPLNTGAALQYLRDNVFTASAGSRRLEKVPQVLILLSGGRSSDSVDAPASALKQMGVQTFAIGTRSSDLGELQKISHDPSSTLSVSEFTELPSVQEKLSSVVSTVEVKVTPITPTVPVERKQTGRDVVFLLDGSDGTRTGFPAMRDFVQRVVDTLSVDDEKDRVSVVQYSREPAVQFYLNTYTTKDEILDTVRGLRHKGGRPLNTGAALQYLRDNVFTASAGSRRLEKVPQVLILLSGGRSSDSVDAPASALKQMGVQTFAIGTRSSDLSELQKISHDPSSTLSVSEFTELPSVQEKLSSVVSTVEVKVTPITPTVPVVQYSREPAVQFYLNTYTTKDEILDTVRGLRHKGGRPLNTGAALQYLRDNVFTASAGSRRLERVPQVLILLSGGRSSDSVDAPASALKQMGVQTFAIGTRSSDLSELQKISHDPSSTLSVSEFTELPSVQEKLSSVVSTVEVKVTPITPTVPVERKPTGRDVVFLLDGSDGTRTGFPAMRDFVQRVVDTLSVDDDKDRVSVVQYSREPAVQFYLNTYTTKDEILDTVRGSRRLEKVPQVLILLSGGRSSDSVDAPASALKQMGVQTFAIGTGSSDLSELQKISHDPSSTLSVSEFTELPSVQEKLSSIVSTVEVKVTPITPTVPVERKPTGRDVVFLLDGSDGTRTGFPAMRDFVQRVVDTLSVDDDKDRVSVVQYSREPAVQFYLNTYTTKDEILDTVRVERKPTGRDVVFLLDGSDGTRTGFPAMRDFVQRVVDTLSVDDDKDRVSVVQYSREPAVQFYLNTYTTKDEILDTVRGLRHKGGRPLNTGAALQYLRDNVFTASAGSRRLEKVPQVLILLSGGRSSDSVDAPASALKQMGVQTFAIGTRSSDLSELQKISHDPSSTLSVSEFTELPSVQEKLSSVVSTVEVKVTPITPTVPVERKPTGRDVVFLLDGSDGTRTGFPAMRDFVQRVVDTLSVDDDKDRVSVVQYSREPAVQFYLNTYTTKDEILDTVRGLRHKGGRPLNTGAALQYLRDNVFTASAGSRRLEKVPQVLILLSGGRSSDSVDAPASALKQMGVQTFAIGTGSSDLSELQKISHDPSSTLSVSEFTELPSVQEKLSSIVSTVEVKVTPITPTVPVERKPTGRDVVFLLDGSDGTRTGFPAMRDFVQRVVDTLSVDDEKDRVSVVQYSREPAVQFYLNTYTTKDEILDTVRGLRHKGGRPLNTGAALQYLRDNVFTASAGSRRLERVPQVLILLSGGRSSDSVDAPASALKQMGVQTFAIGTRSSDLSELQKISHDPSSTLSVSEFTELPSVQEKLSSVVSTVEVKVTPITPTVPVERKPTGRDVVFLLDGSDGTRTGFPAMRDFVQRVVDTLSVDDDKDRVSVVQYSREPAVQFYLNTYTTKDEILDTVRVERKPTGRDVVFLLDGSDGTRTGFPAMRDFVQRVVDTLSVDDDKDRVSVVQYSREPAVQFYLNTYTTKDEILDTVRGLRHKGGRPLNTGAALQYLRDNVFTASAGSRRLEKFHRC